MDAIVGSGVGVEVGEDVAVAAGEAVGTSVGSGAAVGLRRIFATGEGVGSSEQPTIRTTASMALAASRFTKDSTVIKSEFASVAVV